MTGEGSAMEKVELASPEWMGLMHSLLAEHARAAPGDTDFSVCETFTGVPKHLDRQGGGAISWWCRVKGSRVEFGEGRIDDADVESQADFEFILPVARWIYADEVMAEVAAYKQRGVEAGKYATRVTDPTKVPAFMREVHNALAARTA